MKILQSLFPLMMCFFSILPAQVFAQSGEETVIEFFSSNATMEDNPNKQNYNITIFSPDGKWKMQLNYNSPTMFGTFGNQEFNLSGDGRYYNYARNPNNDMVFYSFNDMNVSVTDEGTLYRVKADCRTTNKMHFKVEATIDAPQPEQTVTDDLGFARVEENPFYETYAIYAENENYKLAYGIASKTLIGTFYRADMLMPELYDKELDENVTIISATAVHTQEGSNTRMTVELLSDERILYRLTMYNGAYEVKVEREENITIGGATLQDVTDMYGCFLFAGANEQYQLGVAVRPESVENGRREWTKDDLIMQFTRLYLVAEDRYAEIYDIHVVMDQADKLIRIKADITTMDGVLYHVTMLLEQDGYMPDPVATVNIDFGHVKMLDYTQGLGVIGIGAVVPDKYQLRAYFSGYQFEGSFTTSDFFMEMCDIMVVNGNKYVFHDARYVNATMKKQGTRTFITIDMYGVDDVLYHATMYLDPLDCMQEECTYPISFDDEATMLALRDGDDLYGEYTVQYQNLENTFDENDNIVGNGYYFSFYLSHQGYGVAGEYGYSDGTLAEDEYHAFYEKGCEVRVAPVAGKLKIDPIEQYTIDLGPEIGPVTTYLYQSAFQFVGQNGTVYNGAGSNLLLCIDTEGSVLDLSEDMLQSIEDALAEKGMRVRKVLRDGKIVIERNDKTFDLRGMEIKAVR